MPLTLNNLPLMEVRLSLGLTGCWTADVITSDAASTPFIAGTPAALSLETMALSGTVLRGGEVRSSEFVRIVGGAGGLGLDTTPQGYRSVTAEQVVRDLLAGAGETLSDESDSDLLETEFGLWSVRREQTSTALSRIVEAIGAVWRTLPDGSVWIGVDTFDEQELTNATLIDAKPEQGLLLCGIDSPELLPGRTVSLDGRGGRVSVVDYWLRSGEYRMRVLLVD